MTSDPTDGAHFRQVLGHVPTAVCVVAALDGERPVGMAIGSLFSISLDPPLVGFCVGRSSSSWPAIRAAGQFCVSVLSADQEAASRRFATSGIDKFAGVGWTRSGLGSPLLDGAVAWIDCRLGDVVDAGDHEIVVGRVDGLDVSTEANPLVFFRGGYHDLA